MKYLVLAFLALAPALHAAVPAAFEGTAMLRGKLPAGVVMRVNAHYASRLWVPAVAVNATMPVPVPYQRHAMKQVELTAKPDAQGRYQIEFPLHLKGKIGMTFLFDSASITFRVPGQQETLPTWIVPASQPSVDLGRADIPLSDVSRFDLRQKSGSTTTEIHTLDDKTFIGHHVAFPELSGRQGTLDIELR